MDPSTTYTLETALRLGVLVSSAYFYQQGTSSPVKNPTIPPFGPTWAEKREFLFMFIGKYGFPLFHKIFNTMTFFECLSIIITYLDNPAWRALLVERGIPLTPPTFQGPGILGLSLLLVIVLGGAFRLWCYAELGASFTYNVTKSSSKLATSGPYSIVRHPSYLGAVFMLAAVSAYPCLPGTWVQESGILQYPFCRAVLASWIILNGFITNVNLLLRAPDEDEILHKLFGKEWEAWSKVVQYRVFPGLF